MKGAAAKRRGENDEANWWLVTTLILVVRDHVKIPLCGH
jgi:hypothetical protein